MDSFELSFYLKLIKIEILSFKPQIFIKIHVFGFDSILIFMRFNFNLNLECKTNQGVSNLRLKLALKTGLGPKCKLLPVSSFSQFCRILVLQNSPRRTPFAWARLEFLWRHLGEAWASLGEHCRVNSPRRG